MAERRIKIAVLGGGCGAMAAAFELTKTPELRARYEVTVYQQGWRLGGKGASGRNAAASQRIEEHGLHAFLGFYENAFSLMREVYAEWEKTPDNPFQHWTDAFKPQRQISMQEWSADAGGAAGRWSAWNVTCPRLPGEPGDGGVMASVEEMLASLLRLIDAHSEAAHEAQTGKVSVTRPVRSDLIAAVIAHARAELKALERFWHPALEEAHCLVQAMFRASSLSTEKEPHALAQLIAEARDSVRALARSLQPGALDEDWRRLHLVVELGSAIALGIVSDVLPRASERAGVRDARGFDAINGYDFKEWLEWHGASPEVAWSPPIKALYDLGFAYEGGKASREHARAAAGVALRILLSLTFGYKDAPLWKMQAGMGDTVFAPLYDVLAQRGVRFEFFHRVLSLEPSPNGNAVERIVVSRQVELARPYQPLITVKGLPCWPSEPRWDFIKGGDEMAKHATLHDFESAWCLDSAAEVTLEYGRDFDLVVLGVSIGALPDIAPKLRAASARWDATLARTKTVATQSVQLWLTPGLEELGWKAGTTILTAYAEPFDTWGEMSHLLPREDWELRPGDWKVPKSIAYFCGALEDEVPRPPVPRPGLPEVVDSSFPERAYAQVRKNAAAWLDANTGALWPSAVDPPSRPAGLDWNKLVDPEGRTGEARLDAQFWRANIDPTERYVLSVPGSLATRLAPGDSDFVNLYLAGDWTKTSLNAGCAEAAVESGFLAARGITGTRARFL